MNLSILIPLLNEEESLKELYTWIIKVMQSNNYSYEIIFRRARTIPGRLSNNLLLKIQM
jgi:glycosyltransferase involved in cell wall biosynthesis